jgi:hypothetical protein
MDPESKKLLEETLVLARENNSILHKVRSVQKWSTYWQTLKILLIVGIAFGAFYFMEPYVNKMIELYNSISGTTQKVDSTQNSFQDFLKKFSN